MFRGVDVGAGVKVAVGSGVEVGVAVAVGAVVDVAVGGSVAVGAGAGVAGDETAVVRVATGASGLEFPQPASSPATMINTTALRYIGRMLSSFVVEMCSS